ncbi:unnamed protein product, partial [marine sediment metagenome]
VLAEDVLGGETTTWVYTPPTSPNPWSDGESYDVMVRARDRVTQPSANYEVVYATITFTYDISAPVSVVTKPGNLGYITAPLGVHTTVQGTVDTDASWVKIRIKDLGTSTTHWSQYTEQWISFTTWNVCNIYSPGYWRILISSGAWIDGIKYQVVSDAKDNSLPSGNDENEGIKMGNKFVYDISYPSSTIITPGAVGSDLLLKELVSISGTAWDTAPNPHPEICLDDIQGLYIL